MFEIIKNICENAVINFNWLYFYMSPPCCFYFLNKCWSILSTCHVSGRVLLSLFFNISLYSYQNPLYKCTANCITKCPNTRLAGEVQDFMLNMDCWRNSAGTLGLDKADLNTLLKTMIHPCSTCLVWVLKKFSLERIKIICWFPSWSRSYLISTYSHQLIIPHYKE